MGQTYFDDGKSVSVNCESINQLGLVRLAHQFVQVTLRPQENLQLSRLRQVHQRCALLEEQIQEVCALAKRRRIFVA